jgi:hypothetical protein
MRFSLSALADNEKSAQRTVESSPAIYRWDNDALRTEKSVKRTAEEPFVSRPFHGRLKVAQRFIPGTDALDKRSL